MRHIRETGQSASVETIRAEKWIAWQLKVCNTHTLTGNNLEIGLFIWIYPMVPGSHDGGWK